MNLNQIINMAIRMIMRRGINAGITVVLMWRPVGANRPVTPQTTSASALMMGAVALEPVC